MSGVLPHVLIVLFALVVTSSAGWYITKGKLDGERVGRQHDRTLYTLEQERYKTNALNEKMLKEREYNDIKQKQDAAYSRLLDEYRTSVMRYKAVKSQDGRRYLPPSTDPASIDARPGEDSLIPIPENDLLICAENTAKAQVAHDWALEIQKQK